MSAYAKKTCWLIVSIIFFTLGLIGIVLPVIPQIPFLLIAFFCLSKVSPKIRNWVRKRKFYQEHVLKFENKVKKIYNTSPKLAWLRKLTKKFYKNNQKEV
ncbi:DUF454 family protein [Ligilactobacillus cholophilus]|uniref:DUF454 family protein n=1 Tax=Ligilactobacillus cholophilus TaxID=3050131 RepID=UPI0025AF25C0|nr:DUF454 family protein [Ligilactobacillus cholophilus]